MKKKKILPFFLVLLLLMALIPALPVHALSNPEIESRVAVVMERTTGEVYFSQNADERIYPASTTKIMTVLLAVEAVESGRVALADEVTAGPSMSYDLIADGTSAGIVEGETMTLENLLYCAMLSSANEACNIIAEYIAGTISGFVEQMNARARELGCANTHFANAHGLPNSSHYTTASDFCRIALEATTHDLFMQICSTETYDVPATNVNGVRNLVNSNALISANSMYGSGYLYPDAAGIKTGYTNDAGYCLVSTASRDGIDLLAAVFGGYAKDGENDRRIYTNFTDSILLYDWVFDNFSYQQVLDPSENVASVDVNLGQDADYVNLRPASAVSLLLPNDYDPNEFTLDLQVYSIQQGETVTAPVTAGEVLGEVSVLRGEQNCGTVKLVAASSVDLSRTQYIKSHLRETAHTSTFHTILAVTILILALYIVWVILYRVRYRRYRAAIAAARGDAPNARERAVRSRRPASPAIEFFPPGEEEDDVSGDVLDDLPEPEDHTGHTQPKPVQMPEPEPEEPPAPSVESFAQEEREPANVETAEAGRDAPLSMLQSKADRDYFEEFFKKSK